MAIFLVPIMIIQLVAMVFMTQLNDLLKPFLESLDGERVLIITLSVLLVVTAGVFAAAVARFRRTRLFLA
jgi:hypothetical protein